MSTRLLPPRCPLQVGWKKRADDQGGGVPVPPDVLEWWDMDVTFANDNSIIAGHSEFRYPTGAGAAAPDGIPDQWLPSGGYRFRYLGGFVPRFVGSWTGYSAILNDWPRFDSWLFFQTAPGDMTIYESAEAVEVATLGQVTPVVYKYSLNSAISLSVNRPPPYQGMPPSRHRYRAERVS